MFTHVPVHYDTIVQSITTGNTSATASTFAPTVCYGNNYILEAEIRTNTSVEDLDDIDNWRYGINQLGLTTHPLVESENSDFNVGGDWTEMDKTVGKISIRVNTTSTTLNTDLSTSSGKRYYSEISGVSNTTGNIVTVAVFPINIKNVIYKDTL